MNKSNFTKTLVFLMVIVLATMAMSGCSKTETNESEAEVAEVAEVVEVVEEVEELRFTFVSPLIGHPYWVTVADGVIAAGEDFGVDVKEVGPTVIDINEQIKQIEIAIASKVDGILTMALNPEAFTPVINQAKEAGIPVVLIDTDAPDSNRDVYAGTSNYEAGRQAGLAMVESTGGTAKIGIITGAIDAANLNQRIDGFTSVIEAEAGMEIVALEPSNSDLLQASEKAQSMLKANPEITAFFGVSASDILGAAKVVEEKDLVGQITLVGFDGLEETLDYIRDGIIYATIVQKPYMMGYMGVELLTLLNDGVIFDDPIKDTGVTTITLENVDSN